MDARRNPNARETQTRTHQLIITDGPALPLTNSNHYHWRPSAVWITVTRTRAYGHNWGSWHLDPDECRTSGHELFLSGRPVQSRTHYEPGIPAELRQVIDDWIGVQELVIAAS